MTPTDVVEVIATGPPEEMERIAEQLVTDAIIACVHYTDIRSTYWWQGQIEHARETRAAMHTTTARVAEVKTRIADAHPFAVACTLVTPTTDGNPDYLDWVRNSVATCPSDPARAKAQPQPQ